MSIFHHWEYCDSTQYRVFHTSSLWPFRLGCFYLYFNRLLISIEIRSTIPTACWLPITLLRVIRCECDLFKCCSNYRYCRPRSSTDSIHFRNYYSYGIPFRIWGLLDYTTYCFVPFFLWHQSRSKQEQKIELVGRLRKKVSWRYKVYRKKNFHCLCRE